MLIHGRPLRSIFWSFMLQVMLCVLRIAAQSHFKASGDSHSMCWKPHLSSSCYLNPKFFPRIKLLVATSFLLSPSVQKFGIPTLQKLGTSQIHYYRQQTILGKWIDNCIMKGYGAVDNWPSIHCTTNNISYVIVEWKGWRNTRDLSHACIEQNTSSSTPWNHVVHAFSHVSV